MVYTRLCMFFCLVGLNDSGLKDCCVCICLVGVVDGL